MMRIVSILSKLFKTTGIYRYIAKCQATKNIYFLNQIFIVICMHPLIGVYFLIILMYT